eukprot:2122219-Rhodomonas_salina.1
MAAQILTLYLEKGYIAPNLAQSSVTQCHSTVTVSQSVSWPLQFGTKSKMEWMDIGGVDFYPGYTVYPGRIADWQ